MKITAVFCLSATLLLLSNTSRSQASDLENDNNLTNTEAVGHNSLSLFDNYKLETNDAAVVASKSQNNFLHITSGTKQAWPGIIIRPVGKRYWNLKSYSKIVLTVNNLDASPLKIFLRADSPVLTNKKLRPWIAERITVSANASQDIHLLLKRQNSSVSNLIGMEKLPSGLSMTGFEPSKISKFVVFLKRSSEPRSFEIGNLRAVGEYDYKSWEDIPKKDFFPIVDRFGQYRHSIWPNKVFSDNDLHEQKKEEEKNLKQHSRSVNWNKYGGWVNGPKFKATQHFRVKKVGDYWWFIDPDGYLFWSHGIDVVSNTQKTIITGRGNYFSNLSDTTSSYYSDLFTTVKKNQVIMGHYIGKENLKTYDFFQSNLKMKYGSNWNQHVNKLTHKRLSSWGINTLGLWSAREITSMGRTPYVEWLYYHAPKIGGRGKYKTNMVDMWDPKFIERLKKTTNKLNKLKEDPWCIGVFVDNELPWEDAKLFAAAILSASSNQPAKIKFIEFLIQKYNSINKFNRKWKTKYRNWNELENPIVLNDENIPWGIANEFYRMSAGQYYKTVQAFIKQNAPNLLYLGSRLNGEFPIPASEAAKYVDVISYNLYRTDVSDFAPPNNTDKPILIGEWHFGSDDRGVFGAGLVRADSQLDRAKKYKQYLESAIKNTYIIGAHWFQYMDQPTTGRISNEQNHQIGFVSITDTPYHETIEASREIGLKIYTTRQNLK